MIFCVWYAMCWHVCGMGGFISVFEFTHFVLASCGWVIPTAFGMLCAGMCADWADVFACVSLSALSSRLVDGWCSLSLACYVLACVRSGRI